MICAPVGIGPCCLWLCQKVIVCVCVCVCACVQGRGVGAHATGEASFCRLEARICGLTNAQ